MADNRIYLKCRICGDTLFLGKRYGSSGYFLKEYDGIPLKDKLNEFYDKHECCDGFDCFEIEYEHAPYEVYRRIRQGADGNQGVEYENAAQFETADEANAFIAKQTDKNGWVDYVVERSEDGET